MVKPSPSSSSSSSSYSSSPFNSSTNAHQIPPIKPRLKRTWRARDANEAQSNPGQTKRSSIYRGVTKHRWTGRYEAHLWDKHCWNKIQNKKGKQGAYDDEEAAAHTYDLAALKYWGPDALLNFPSSTYEKEYEEMQSLSRDEFISSLRRRSSGFSRGASKYRGVSRHHHNGRWEARIGCVFGNKYLYLGTFNTQEEAARAYDLAALECRGPNAVTNFDINIYTNRPLQVQNQIPTQHQQKIFVDQPPLQLPFPNEPPTATITNTLPIHDQCYCNNSLQALIARDFVDDSVPISNLDSYNITSVSEPKMGTGMINIDCSGDFLDFLECDGFMDDIDSLLDECGLLESCDVNGDAISGDLDGSAKATDQAELGLDQITQLLNSDGSNYSLPISICS